MPDMRDIRTGRLMPVERYSDQPYIVKTDDGAWLCVLTTGRGVEGAPGQHVISMRSADQGASWTEPLSLEPADGPEASYAVLLKVPSGRIYCFYNHNTDNIRTLMTAEGPFKRVDSLGHFVFRYTDDGGRSWSPKRYPVPVREMEMDRTNPYGGRIRMFWNTGRPFIREGAAFVSLYKIGEIGHGDFLRTEGVLLKSANILTERDPDKIVWETLPDGDRGLRAPAGGGPVAEEQSYSLLSDGSIFAVYRTIDGHPACAYSRDGAHTWSAPEYMRYADGRLIKHPRAANFAWRCSNGKYLYWFHNNGGRSYDDRNPVWLCGGVEADSPAGKVIRWSQPEIALYDDDPYVRISYPDLVEDEGRYFLTETQKNLARVHELDSTLLEGLWGQFENAAVARRGLILELAAGTGSLPAETDMPNLPAFTKRDNKRPDHGTLDLRQGFSLEVWFRLDTLAPGQRLLDSRTVDGQGLCLLTTERGTIEIVLNDGRTENRWDCDRGMLRAGERHHVAAIVDGGPRIITFVVDGRLCDGGDCRQFGWGRFSPNLRHAAGCPRLRLAPGLDGQLMALRIYDRALRTSEAVGNFRAGV